MENGRKGRYFHKIINNVEIKQYQLEWVQHRPELRFHEPYFVEDCKAKINKKQI